jgi:hypothetical protein
MRYVLTSFQAIVWGDLLTVIDARSLLGSVFRDQVLEMQVFSGLCFEALRAVGMHRQAGGASQPWMQDDRSTILETPYAKR